MVKVRVDAVAKSYSQVNVESTMKQLVLAGALLRVAYAAAGDSDAAHVILELFSKHQSFTGDCVVVTGNFIQGALDALEHHQDALDALQDAPVSKEKVFRALARCETIATTMAAEADRTVIQAKEMETLSETALVSAKMGQTKSVEERKLIDQKRNEAEQKKVRREMEIEELNSMIKDLEEKETKYETKAEKEAARADRAMLINALVGLASSMAMGPMAALMPPKPSDDGKDTNVNDNGTPDTSEQESKLQAKKKKEAAELGEKELKVKTLDTEIEDLKAEGTSEAIQAKITQATKERDQAQAEVDSLNEVVKESKKELTKYADMHIQRADTAEAKASQAAAARMAALSERREAAGDLAAAARNLANLKTERSEIVKAIKALDICVKIMGQFKTTFTNVRIFWETIASMCSKLKGLGKTELEDKSIKSLAKYVETQIVRWISIGHLNCLANNGVLQAHAKVDDGMRKLPTKAEAQKILEREADGIANMLEQEYLKVVILDSAAPQEIPQY